MRVSARLLFLGFTGLCALLFIFIYTFSPLESDDYWFLEGTQGMLHGWKMFLVACDTMKERWLTDTGRLGNIINPLFLALFPKWVFNILSGGAIFLMIIYACRLASLRLGSLRSYLLMGAIVFCYPWYDYLFCVTFGINYVWGITLAVMAAYYLLHVQSKPFRIALICLLCFMAGWFHEGFGVPLSCGGVAVGLLRWRHHLLSREYLIKLAFLCVGTLMICLSPVFWNRAETAVSNIYKFPVKELIMQIGPGVAVFIAFVCLLLLIVCRKQRRISLMENEERKEKLLFLSVMIAASLAVMIKYYNGPRTGAGVVMFGCIGIIWLSGFLYVRLPGILRMIGYLTAVAAVCLNLSAAVSAQRLLLREYNEIVRLFAASRSGVIYYDLTYPQADLTMFKTTVRQFHERIPKLQLAWYLDKEKGMVILPKALEGLQGSDVKPATREGFYLYEGYILLDPAVELDSPRITVMTAGGEEEMTRFRSDTFIDKTGREWIFIMPHIQTLNRDLRIEDVLPD